MRPIVKRVAKWLGWGIFAFALLLFIGFRWGLTPLPKPPRGVRIEPLLRPITRENLRSDNGALYYIKAVEVIQKHPLSKESKDEMEAIGAGVILGDTNAFQQTFIEVREALDLAREGSRAPQCQMPWIKLDGNTGDLTALRQLARLLVADGKLAERTGNSSGAIDDYLTVVKLGTDCAKGGSVIFRVVGDAIVRMGTQAIRAWTIQTATSPEALQDVMAKINNFNAERVPFAETLRYELLSSKEFMIRSMFAQGYRQKFSVNKHTMFGCFDAAFGELVQDAERPFWESNAKAIVQKWDIQSNRVWLMAFNRPIPRLMLAMLLPTAESARGRTVLADLELEITPVVCALKAYELTHGTPPEHLAELVPNLLLTVPIDPFDGKPLRYRRDGDGWVVWSVGSDLKDDNAAWHEFKYHKRGEKRTGGDIFFKSTEPQDDLAWYLEQHRSEKKN